MTTEMTDISFEIKVVVHIPNILQSTVFISVISPGFLYWYDSNLAWPQGEERHPTIATSQLWPMYPFWQLQLYPLTPSKHVPKGENRTWALYMSVWLGWFGATPSHVLTLIIHYFSKNEFKLGSNLSKRDGLNTSRHYETLVAKL